MRCERFAKVKVCAAVKSCGSVTYLRPVPSVEAISAVDGRGPYKTQRRIE